MHGVAHVNVIKQKILIDSFIQDKSTNNLLKKNDIYDSFHINLYR